MTRQLSGNLFRIALLVTAWSTLTVAVAEPLPKGKSSFMFVDAKGDPSRPIRVWLYAPSGCDLQCPLQFVMHGVQRNAETYLDGVSPLADTGKFIAVAPEFSRKFYPQDKDYTLGGMTTGLDPERWSFAVPEHLFDELKIRYGFTHLQYRLFGHSAGGQFVHRLHLFYPNHRANPIIAANPGWYTLLEWGSSDKRYQFPYTTLGSNITAEQARAALSRPFVLMLGRADTDPSDSSLNKSAGAMAQGSFRLARGDAFFANAQAAAKALDVTIAWSRAYVDGVGHDGARMAAAAIAYTERTN